MMQETVQSMLKWGTRTLSEHSPTSELDAAVLLAHVLQTNRAAIYARFNDVLDAEQKQAYEALIARRKIGEPVAYLTNQREFYGLSFYVDQRVLVPRPDTEILVERAINWLKQRHFPCTVVDIGTGSGCIAVTLAHAQPQHYFWALDVSREALEVARINAAHHGVQQRIGFRQSDGISAVSETVQLIVSNPPYTILNEIDQNVYDWEPHLALDGGDQGLELYQAWLPTFAKRLDPQQSCAVMLEIGAWQGVAVKEIAAEVWPTATITSVTDLGGRDRVIEILIPADD